MAPLKVLGTVCITWKFLHVACYPMEHYRRIESEQRASTGEVAHVEERARSVMGRNLQRAFAVSEARLGARMTRWRMRNALRLLLNEVHSARLRLRASPLAASYPPTMATRSRGSASSRRS